MNNINITNEYGYIYGAHGMPKIACINSLYIYKQYRNQGHGTNLIKEFISTVLKKGCSRIILDDMTDNFNKTNNIYVKLGFRYIDTERGPEMFLNKL